MPEWNYQPLGVVAPAVQAPFPAATDEVWNLSLEEIESGTGRVVQKVTARVSDLGSSKCSFSDEHVLYSKLRPYLNKVVVPEGPGVGTSELIPLRPRKETLDRNFLAWYLRSPGFLEFSAQNTRGANLPRIAMDALWEHRVPTPPLAEQRRIVGRIREAMSRVDGVRRLRSESIMESKGLLPSLLKEVFDEVASRADRVTIGELATESRYGTSEKCTPENAGTPVLRIPNVAGGHVNFVDLKFLPGAVAATDPLAVRAGDLLLVRTNGSPDMVGRCAVVPPIDRTFAYASYLIRVRLDGRRADPKYVSFFLASTLGRDQIAAKRHTSAGQYNINTQDIKSIEIPLPPLARQRVLVQRMSEVEKTVQTTGTELSDAQARDSMIPSAILRKAFAGEL